MATNANPEDSANAPCVVVSLPCAVCGHGEEPDELCATCRGEGIVLRRVYGQRDAGRFTVDTPLVRRGQVRADRPRTVAAGDGADARNDFETIETADTLSLLRARPVTGHTHQIRAHLQVTGLLVVGDPHYGPLRADRAVEAPRGQLLHARRLRFDALDVAAPWPSESANWLRARGFQTI